jgi:Zn-dependent metalloprotease
MKGTIKGKLIGMCAAATLVLSAGAASAAITTTANRATPGLSPNAVNLLDAFPGAQLFITAGKVTGVSGVGMSAGRSANEAEQAFWRDHAAAFGIDRRDLVVDRIDATSDGRFTVFAYTQRLGGLKVDGGIARLLVRNPNVGGDNAEYKVVYVGGKLAQNPAGGFAPDALDGAQALAIARAHPLYRNLPSWTTPEMQVYFGEGDGEWGTATRVWTFVGEQPDLNQPPAKFRFFIDAATGQILAARSEIHHIDVVGQVNAFATPGSAADRPGNPPVVRGVPGVRIAVPGGNTGFTDPSGAFNVANAGSAPVSITATLTSGQWTGVADSSGTAITSQTLSVTPGVSSTFLLNATPAGLVTAQVNAFIWVTNTRNFFKGLAPSFTGIDAPLATNVNLAQTCNAFYNGTSTNYYQAGGGCNNTAFSSVAAHEYGHHLVNRLGLAQGAFGEGFSDVTSMLQFDEGQLGIGFRTTEPSWVRNPESANQQYPCASSAIHTCGQIVGGVWWESRRNLGARYGSGPGMTIARNLWADWALITIGGIGLNSFHPQAVTEVLTIDDDDANLSNGTPNYPQLCAAFVEHGQGLACPALQLVTFAFPNGLPTTLTPNQSTQIRFDVTGLSGTPTAGSGAAFFRINGGSFQNAGIQQLSANSYIATIPGQACESSIDFYFRSGVNSAPDAFSPATAPAGFYSAVAATGVATRVDDNFETANPGWTVTNSSGLTSGAWERVDPEPTAAQPGDDTTPPPGVNCWVTDGRAGTSVGSFDVDGGTTTLTSPAFDLSGLARATIAYNLWYTNNYNGVIDDTFTAEISGNGGTTWQNLQTLTGAQNPGWRAFSFNITNPALLTNNVRLRFNASDLGAGSIVEAALDDLRITSLQCGTPCLGDWNGDGVVDFNDLLAYLNDYNAQLPIADLNADGIVDFNDLLEFLNRYNTPC